MSEANKKNEALYPIVNIKGSRLIDENAVATAALKKTFVFLFYSVLTPLLVLFTLMLSPFESMSSKSKELFAIGLFVTVEGFLFFSAIYGILPGSKIEKLKSFSERDLARMIALLSVLPLLFFKDHERYLILNTVLNGAFFVSSLVFFIVKSMVSRRIRWEILLFLAIPAGNLLLSFL
ncbi:MAG: hypothetical protein HQM08_14070 [Candidatus Riflebacteria bacterium]|nr:hypothetical protein [Candidatus Riflebacteria bacterium]